MATESKAYRDPMSLVVMHSWTRANVLHDAPRSDQPQGHDERATLEIATICESMTVATQCNAAMHSASKRKVLKVLLRGRQSENRLKFNLRSQGSHNFWGRLMSLKPRP